MSEPFSAGQHWICFEIVAGKRRLVIARVRLPRHPDLPATVTEEDEAYAMLCECCVMEFVREEFPSFSFPTARLYGFAGPGSEGAAEVGAPYMLIEGFCGNSLQDVEPDICNLPVSPGCLG
jgi:hypothetical protein